MDILENFTKALNSGGGVVCKNRDMVAALEAKLRKSGIIRKTGIVKGSMLFELGGDRVSVNLEQVVSGKLTITDRSNVSHPVEFGFSLLDDEYQPYKGYRELESLDPLDYLRKSLKKGGTPLEIIGTSEKEPFKLIEEKGSRVRVASDRDGAFIDLDKVWFSRGELCRLGELPELTKKYTSSPVSVAELESYMTVPKVRDAAPVVDEDGPPLTVPGGFYEEPVVSVGVLPSSEPSTVTPQPTKLDSKADAGLAAVVTSTIGATVSEIQRRNEVIRENSGNLLWRENYLYTLITGDKHLDRSLIASSLSPSTRDLIVDLNKVDAPDILKSFNAIPVSERELACCLVPFDRLLELPVPKSVTESLWRHPGCIKYDIVLGGVKATAIPESYSVGKLDVSKVRLAVVLPPDSIEFEEALYRMGYTVDLAKIEKDNTYIKLALGLISGSEAKSELGLRGENWSIKRYEAVKSSDVMVPLLACDPDTFVDKFLEFSNFRNAALEVKDGLAEKILTTPLVSGASLAKQLNCSKDLREITNPAAFFKRSDVLVPMYLTTLALKNIKLDAVRLGVPEPEQYIKDRFEKEVSSDLREMHENCKGVFLTTVSKVGDEDTILSYLGVRSKSSVSLVQLDSEAKRTLDKIGICQDTLDKSKKIEEDIKLHEKRIQDLSKQLIDAPAKIQREVNSLFGRTVQLIDNPNCEFYRRSNEQVTKAMELSRGEITKLRDMEKAEAARRLNVDFGVVSLKDVVLPTGKRYEPLRRDVDVALDSPRGGYSSLAI